MKILITGASSGIGYLTALTLAKRGHIVYLTCHNNGQAKSVSSKVKAFNNIKVLKINITKREDRQKVLDLDIDVLFNNAAIAEGGSIVEADMDRIRENFEINVFSSFELLQMVIRQMIKKNHGRVVIMSSMAGVIPIPFVGIYGSTKSSISMLTNTLKKELKLIGSNVDVALIEPGLYHTGFNNMLLDSKYDDGKYFKNIKKKVYNIEHFLLKLGEKRKLDSIVVQIVRAIEDKKIKKVYRAPFFQNFFLKIYSIFK